MTIIIIFLSLLALAILTLLRPIYGIMGYYVIRIVIPSVSRVGSFSFNTLALGMVLLCLLPKLKKYYNGSDIYVKSYINAVSFIVGGLFVLTFFGDLPFLFQWSSLFQMFMTEIVPSILLALFLTKASDYKRFCYIICIMALFTAIYGIYTYITFDNPIFTIFNNSGEEGYVLEDYASGRLGLKGIAVGIYNDKIAFSLVCLLLLTFLISKNNIKRLLQMVTVVIVFVAMFLSTQRTALFCIGLFFAIMMLMDRKNKLVKRYFKVAVALLVIMVMFNSDSMIMDAFYSIFYIFDDSMQQKLGIGGSSTDMRMLQFANGFNYLGWERILQGEGYNFPAYYYTYIFKREWLGLYPRFLGFESFLLKTLMGSGLIGIVVWFIGLFKMFKALNPVRDVYDIAFFTSYFFAIAMTDTSSSFYLFFFLLVLNYKRYLPSSKAGNSALLEKHDLNQRNI